VKLTKTHIAVFLVIAIVIITLNAVWRVRYFGQKEREYQEGLLLSPEAGRLDAGPE
jgi:hypothetical protein